MVDAADIEITGLEHASVATAASEPLSRRLAHAPAAWRAAVDRNRVVAGMVPLWPELAVRKHAEPHTRQSSPAVHVLCGVVAPHVSRPIAATGERWKVREWFDPAAWRAALDRVERGQHVTLLDQHRGAVLASTADGSLTLSIDKRYGLLFEAEIRRTITSRRLADAVANGGSPVSVSFTPLKTATRRLLGRDVRAVLDCRVDHVALVGDDSRAVYPGANCALAKSGSKADRAAAMDAAKDRVLDRLHRYA
jgi:hypothetical protein